MIQYYDSDPRCCAWIRQLIADALLAPGDVYCEPVQTTDPTTVGGRRAHFFAGIGGWEYACELAGWPDSIPLWTGSCPCQPFSVAGKRLGTADERHVWPDWLRLIAICRPPVIVGEQVAGAPGRAWLAGVRADMEALGYAVGAADLCAAGVGAPHIRQRIYWIAYLRGARLEIGTRPAGIRKCATSDRGRDPGGVANARIPDVCIGPKAIRGAESVRGSNADRLGHSSCESARQEFKRSGKGTSESLFPASNQSGGSGIDMSPPWRSHILLPCRDGRQRRIPPQPELFPLAHGVPERVAILRGAGNAIVPQVAAIFLRAVLGVIQDA